MCGILGVYVNDPSTVFVNLKAIYRQQKTRGMDGCGIAIKRGNRIIRVRGLHSDQLFSNEKFVSRLKALKVGDIVIMHHRYGTSGARGDITPSGNHPIANEEYNFYLVHNGHISSYGEHYNTLRLQGHSFETEIHTTNINGTIVEKDITDSEVLVHYLESEPTQSIKILSEVSGSISIAFINQTDDRLYLYTNSGSIKVYDDKQGNHYFSSEISRSLKEKNTIESKTIKSIDNHSLYFIESDGVIDTEIRTEKEKEEIEEIKWEENENEIGSFTDRLEQ